MRERERERECERENAREREHFLKAQRRENQMSHHDKISGGIKLPPLLQI